MNRLPFIKDTGKTARVSTMVIFLALIRCLSEPFRLQHYSSSPLSLQNVAPFLVGALVAAIALLLMPILSYYGMQKLVF